MPKNYTKKELEQVYQSLIGMRQGHLVIIRPATPEENKSRPGQAKWWLCKCDCGNEVFVKTAYIYKGPNTTYPNYQANSCGCLRIIRHFIASSKVLTMDDENWLYQFYYDDWDKFQLLHQSLMRTSGVKAGELSLEEYKNYFEYWWTDYQFNKIYTFWKKQNAQNTFYDWAKPSLDHIIPRAKGGTNDLDNLQFLTVYENLAKRDLTLNEWNQFKQDTHSISDYFIENIMQNNEGGDN